MAPNKMAPNKKKQKKKHTTRTKEAVVKKDADEEVKVAPPSLNQLITLLQSRKGKEWRENLIKECEGGSIKVVKVIGKDGEEMNINIVNVNPQPRYKCKQYHFLCVHCCKLFKNFSRGPKHLKECDYWNKKKGKIEEIENCETVTPMVKIPGFENCDEDDDSDEGNDSDEDKEEEPDAGHGKDNSDEHKEEEVNDETPQTRVQTRSGRRRTRTPEK